MQVNLLNDNKTFLKNNTGWFRKCRRSDFEEIGAEKYYDNKDGDTLICADS